jgi:hypothetical protein
MWSSHLPLFSLQWRTPNPCLYPVKPNPVPSFIDSHTDSVSIMICSWLIVSHLINTMYLCYYLNIKDNYLFNHVAISTPVMPINNSKKLVSSLELYDQTILEKTYFYLPFIRNISNIAIIRSADVRMSCFSPIYQSTARALVD